MSMMKAAPISDDAYRLIAQDHSHWLYHTRSWHNVLQDVFDWTVLGFTRIDEARLQFHLPVIRKLTPSLSSKFVALPLSHHVPPIGENVAQAYLDLPDSVRVHARLPGTQDDGRVITELALNGISDADALMAKFHKSHIIRKIRRAEREAYHAQIDNSDAAIDTFWNLQAETRRRQGSPTFPRAFFRKMRDHLGDVFRLHTVTRDGEIVAGVIFLDYESRSLYGYGASVDDREIWSDGVNQLAMWDAIRTSLERGINVVDFGISPTGLPELATYKERWGGVSSPLIYTATGEATALQSAASRDSHAIKTVSGLLKRTPLPLYKALSPLLLKFAAE